MPLNRTYLFISISSLALLTVLMIQVNWIVQAARMKEELFSEKANLVLSKTADALMADKKTYRNLAAANMVLSKKANAFATGKVSKQMTYGVGENDIHTIDSLLQKYMDLYRIHIDYFFEIKSLPLSAIPMLNWKNDHGKQQSGSYQTCIGGEPEKNNLELRLVFPEKSQFIAAETGIPFITSVMLILVVMVMSWHTILSLLKEKKISEHTTEFLNNMTHEFKTPLTNISLAGKMIAGASIQEAKLKHYTEIILHENEKLKLQVEQVLSMTALERGEIPLHRSRLDFHQLIRDTVKNIGIQIEFKQGTIQVQLAAEHYIIQGDKTHLTNAICNLIDNAVKYTKAKPELDIQTMSNAHNLIVSFSDKGIGIERRYQKKIFQKFFRIPTGNVHNVKGFGLGLAYVKRIVKMHSGTIRLQSESGTGTTFIITLPHV